MPSGLSKPFSVRETVQLVLRVALDHHVRGRLREAAELYATVQEMDPGNADATFLLGLLALKAGNSDAAESLLTIAARQMPKAGWAQRALGDALLRNGRAGAALASYWKALALGPEQAASYADIGAALLALKPDGGNDQAAAVCFARALELDSSCAAAHTGMGEIHLRARCAQEAEESLRQAIRIRPKYPRALRLLAGLMSENGDCISAIQFYRQALALEPDADTWAGLGATLAREECWEEANEAYRQALTLQPEQAAGGAIGDAIRKMALRRPALLTTPTGMLGPALEVSPVQ